MRDNEDPGGIRGRGRRTREESDQHLVALVVAGTDGEAWKLLSERLVSYGLPVLTRWARSGKLLGKAAQAVKGGPVRGFSRLPDVLRLVGDDAEVLAIEMVTKTLRPFPAKLREWDPELGGIKTYYVGFCLMQLPDAYDTWCRREVAPVLAAVSDEHIAELLDKDPTPDEVAAVRDAIRMLAKDDRQLQRMLLLRIDGYTFPEIAAIISKEGVLTTPREARTRLRSLIQRAYELRSSAE